ncbi:MAG: 2TM domain-containing protein [bacterium]|nr:2TM domain-containing protein [bacterium]
MTKPDTNTPEGRARKRLNEFTGLMWHIATFVIANVFLWVIAPGAAIWVTIAWGVGLAFHVAAYLLDESGFQQRRYQRFLAEEQERDAG